MLRDKVKTLPLSPGIYIMKSDKGKILYVGKASSLRSRVRSYFLRDQPPKTKALMESVADIEYVECDTEAQALILEAALIKEKKPKFNISLRDDKSYPYIEITNEEFPRVFISRPKEKTKSILFGPYMNAKLLRPALEMIRKIFPYCSCKGRRKKGCLYLHLKLCPGPCQSRLCKKEYKENIDSIKKILKGQRKQLIAQLDKKMRSLSVQERYEDAARLRDKILALENLYQGRAKEHELAALKKVLNLPTMPLIIEAMDISNLRGTEATGSVVVFRNGTSDKNSYRRYKIKEVKGIDDYAMIAEVTRRRYSRIKKEGHSFADLIIIDGGKGHVQTAKDVLDTLGMFLPLIGIAKRNEEVWFADRDNPLIIPKDSVALHLIQRIRDEAHRFARNYHLLRRSKKLPKVKKKK